jgi:hypothetical protein
VDYRLGNPPHSLPPWHTMLGVVSQFHGAPQRGQDTVDYTLRSFRFPPCDVLS